MLSLSQASDLNIKPELLQSLMTPLFYMERPLWTKKDCDLTSNFFRSLKKYEFTKIGKTLGFQTTRFLAISKKNLYYFDDQQSEQPLGSCDIQNVYCDWRKLQEDRYVFVLNNGNSSTAYFFRQQSFIRENQSQLARYTVQLGFYNKYNIIQELGSGSFATVYRVTDNATGQQYSAKVLSKDTPLPAIKHQIQILRQMVGVNNVCQYYSSFQNDSEIIILTRFLPGRDLRTVISYTNGFHADQIKTIIAGVCNGLHQCHRNNIIHRDIKPQNIIIDLDTMQPTIIDFGLSLDIKKSFALNRCGTSSYMAPEVYNFPQTNQPYNYKCDIFSLGVLSHLLMLGNNPLKTDDQLQLKQRKDAICWSELQAKSLWGQQGHEFLSKTLSVDVRNRWSISQALNSQFLLDQKQLSRNQMENCSTIQDRTASLDF